MENENQNVPVEQPSNAGGVNGNDSKDFVKFDSYKKALDEKKRAQDDAMQMRDELEKFREQDMKRKGKTDELLNAKDKRIAELESLIKTKDQTYTWSSLTKEIKTEAIKSGCKNPEKLIKLMSDDDLKELSQNINDDFTINGEALKNVIEKNKQENYFLFESSNKKVVNGNPTTKIEDDAKDLSKLSLDELKALHKKTYK